MHAERRPNHGAADNLLSADAQADAAGMGVRVQEGFQAGEDPNAALLAAEARDPNDESTPEIIPVVQSRWCRRPAAQ